MDPKYQQVLTVLQQAQKLVPGINAKDPASIDRAKKINLMVSKLRAAPVPPEIKAAIMQFDDTIGARPEVSGVKTQVQGSVNKWEDSHPAPIPFARRK